MDYNIRKANENDAPRIYLISISAHKDSYYGQLIPSDSKRRFDEKYTPTTKNRLNFLNKIQGCIKDDNWTILVADNEDTVVGYILFCKDINSAYMIKGLFVDPKFQHNGIGSNLLKAALEYIGEKKVELLVISNNTIAKKLYEKYGFSVARRSEKTFFGAPQDIMTR